VPEYFDLTRASDGKLDIITELGPVTTHFLGTCGWAGDAVLEYAIERCRVELPWGVKFTVRRREMEGPAPRSRAPPMPDRPPGPRAPRPPPLRAAALARPPAAPCPQPPAAPSPPRRRSPQIPFRLSNALTFFYFRQSAGLACARSRLGGTMLLAADPAGSAKYLPAS
jgi:hypothetical protein